MWWRRPWKRSWRRGGDFPRIRIPPASRRRLLRAVRTQAHAAWRAPAAAGVLAVLLLLAVVLALRWSGALQPLELASYDGLIALRARGAQPDPRVVQITVTEADIERYGWPLADGILAAALDRLHAAAPRAIGVDIFRPTPLGPGSDALDRTLQAAPEIIWADRFAEGGWAGITAPARIVEAGRNGFSDVVLDDGAVARRGLLYLDDGRVAQASFPIKLALLYLRAESVRPVAGPGGALRLGAVSLPPFDADPGGYRSADTRGYQILREYRTAHRLAAYPLGALIDGAVPPDAIRDRIVVLGIEADSVKDYMATPAGLASLAILPGVTLHGLFAGQIVAHGLNGVPPTHALSRRAERAAIVSAIIGGGLVAILVTRLAWLLVAIGGGAMVLLFGSVVAFEHAVWLPVAPIVGGWVLSGLVATAAMASAQHTQRLALMRMFSTHVAAPVAREMWRHRSEFLSQGRPRPVRLAATVLFSDVNDFTAAAEDMEPETIVRWLEPYMVTMTQLVDDHGGVVERFSGDGILAMFGCPLPRETAEEIEADAANAVRCALRMRAELARLNDAYRRDGLPEIHAAVGIQSGTLVSCCLGSDRRQQYTTMGDTTNTAARFVTVAKSVMKLPGAIETVCAVVVGEPTLALLGGAFDVEPLGPVELKGKRVPTFSFAVVGEASVRTDVAALVREG